METVMEEGDCLSQEEESAWNDRLDILQLCRICANPNDYLIPIFKGEGLEHELEEKIAKHLPIKVTQNDELPTKLCYQCASILIAWHDMVVGCEEADEKLRAVRSCRSGNQTKVSHEVIIKEILAESNGNSEPNKVLSPMNVSQDEDPKLITSVDMENVIEEEEIASVKPEIMQDATLDTRYVKIEEEMDYYDLDIDDELEDALMSDLESDEEYGTLYNCNICKATSMALHDFLSHSKMHSKEEKQLALAKIVESKMVREEAAKSAAATFGFRVQENLESSVTLYQCIVCGQGNLQLKNVREHSSIHPQFIESNFCSICQRQFQSLKNLNKHLEIHLDNNDLICQYCNKKFEMIDDLEVHEDQHYLAEYMCVDCRESFRSKELVLLHLRETHSEDTNCLICDVKFKSNQMLKKHFMSHATIRAVKRLIPFFICDVCGKKYDSKVSLQRHKLFLHNNRLRYICEHCGFFAYHENPLSEHLEKNHLESENICICCKCGPIINERYNADSQLAEETPIVENICKFCGLKLKSSVGLKLHLKSHGDMRNRKSLTKKEHLLQVSTPESFSCGRCGEVFSDNSLCLTHSSYHVDCVLCDLCGKSFKNEIALNHHLNDVHVTSKKKHNEENSALPFKCKHCSLKFKLEFELEEHSEIHGDMRYQCHFCFKEFTADCDLQDHLNSHDEETNEI